VSLRPDDALLERFCRSLAALTPALGSDDRLGIAVSGGPDSVALLLLAAAAVPNRIWAATVDHRFRDESAREAEQVAGLCRRLAVPHAILTLDWAPPSKNRQALARQARYEALGQWAEGGQLAAVATAHHLDDQAETVLMRLQRGAGVGGLAGIRPSLDWRLRDHRRLHLVRPLLDWRRAELAAICAAANVPTVADPANTDPAHDRARIRTTLSQMGEFAEHERLAASARHLALAEDALEWTTEHLLLERLTKGEDLLSLDTTGLPFEYRRRFLVRLLSDRDAYPLRGDSIKRALDLLAAGRAVTLAGMSVRPRGATWTFRVAPPRRTTV